MPDALAGTGTANGANSSSMGFGTPFDAQLEHLRSKLNLPTEWWDDILAQAHDRAFVVAGAMEADLIADLRAAVDATMAEGGSAADFAKRFDQIVQDHGWTGWTGEGSAQGSAWRAQIIYQTNMSTSYAAGRYKQMTDAAYVRLRPYWRYNHADAVLHPRPLHVAWNGLTLPADHPFWQTHYPPNGWQCHCWANAVAAPAQGDPTEPPAGWNKPDADGNLPGIDTGFGYAPGANTGTELADFVAKKLIKLDGPLGKAMQAAMAPVLAAERARNHQPAGNRGGTA